MIFNWTKMKMARNMNQSKMFIKRISSIVSENESNDFMDELETLIKAKNKGGNKAVLNKFYEMVEKNEKKR